MLLGQGATGSLGLALNEGGATVHVVWPSATGSDSRLHYLQLDQEATPVVAYDLALPPGLLRAPRLLPAPDGRLHLVWAHRAGGAPAWTLWHTQLDPMGLLIGEPAPLSTAAMNAGRFAVASNGSGGGIVAWDSEGDNGLYAVALPADGQRPSEPVLIAPSGQRPAVAIDGAGTLHLVWLEEERILYASFQEGDLGPAAGVEVATLSLNLSDRLDGPVLGLSGQEVVVLWSTFSQSGLEAGTASAEYVSFPVTAPAPSAPQRLWLSPVEEQPYQPYEGDYGLTQLAAPAAVGASSNYVHQPDTAQGLGDELAVAISTNQDYRLDSFVQLAVIIFEAGEFKGYEMAAKTEGLSQGAALAADQSGGLHMVWREGAGGDAVYYATTAADARAELDRLNGEDIANALLSGGMESLVGMMFFPLALGWLLPGLLLLGAWKLIRDNEERREPLSLLLLAISLILYHVTKLLFLPTIQTYVPFSAWLDVPARWRLPLRLGAPILIFAAGILVAELVQRRRTISTLVYFLILAGTDALLTLAVYGVNFLGVF